MAARPRHFQSFLNKLQQVQATSKGWSARCPAHDDRKASLTIGLGKDGRILVKCHAGDGCSTAEIVEAIGLKTKDLFARSRNGHAATNGKAATPPPKPRTFPTAKAAIAWLTGKNGKPTYKWPYHNAAGKIIGYILRWDTKDEKTIRPVSRAEGGWIIGGLQEPRPLYRLQEVQKAKVVYVAEGEKAADALRQLGVAATTSQYGAQAAARSDWKPLAGKQVTILPDHDEAGKKYADDVLELLSRLDPQPEVKIVTLPGLSKGGDAFDWIEAGGTLAKLKGLVRKAKRRALKKPIKPISVKRFKSIVERWLPQTDPIALDVVYGLIAGRDLPGDPLWMFLIGPPGDGKTELVAPLDGHEAVEYISSVSKSGLVSGFREHGADDDDPSLLARLDGKTLVIKDFTPLLDSSHETHSKVFGQLRDVYEGKATYQFGNVGEVPYKAKFNMLCCSTPAVEYRTRGLVALGERFLYVRLGKANRRAKAMQALENANREPEMRAALTKAARRVIAGASTATPIIPDRMKSKLVTMADALARGRTHVPRRRNSWEEETMPTTPETPTRIVKQFVRLAQSVAMLYQRTELSPYDLSIVQRVMLDSLPSTRYLLLNELSKGRATIKRLAKQEKFSTSNVEEELSKLRKLRLVAMSKKNEGRAHRAYYFIHPNFVDAFSPISIPR